MTAPMANMAAMAARMRYQKEVCEGFMRLDPAGVVEPESEADEYEVDEDASDAACAATQCSWGGPIGGQCLSKESKDREITV
jgi:hypothetical protein